jgi:ubiquinone/menaquinone biosynthesis C-methylase UbiE
VRRLSGEPELQRNLEELTDVLERVLEPEAMDTPDEALDYDAMDHSAVNARFVADFLHAHGPCRGGAILDVGTGPARIPIALCQTDARANVLGIDLARHMLDQARRNVAEAALADRIKLELADAKGVPYPDGQFEAVLSNTILHHIPDPSPALAEMVRLVAPGGTLMLRDLYRPDDDATVDQLVETHANGEPAAARALLEASLRAAFTLDEVKRLTAALGLSPEDVTMSSDRHWTLIWRRPSDVH